jgi:hypothetical protein
MSGAFGGGKPDKVEAPKVPDPPPVPVVGDENEELALSELKKKSGFKKTFLTGQLTPKSTGKSKTLG